MKTKKIKKEVTTLKTNYLDKTGIKPERSQFRFKKYTFECTVLAPNGERLRFYFYHSSGKTSEVMNDLRKLYPVVAGYSERTVSLVS